MLEKPALEDGELIAGLAQAYGLQAAEVTFLPLGADVNTAVYRAEAEAGGPYFVKLRRGAFDEIAVALPKWLSAQGMAQVIAPLSSNSGQLWARLGAFTLIVYPFVAGRNGYEVAMSDRHWRELGSALKQLHTAAVPPALTRAIARETYDPGGRALVEQFVAPGRAATIDDPAALELAAFLALKRGEILNLVRRAEHFARELQAQPPEFVVCHADVHAGNVLIDAHDKLFIVDWDAPILAVKERDLMFVGGAQGFSGHTPDEEARLFYQAYGPAQINPLALAYYRYERIIQDIAAYCEQLLSTSGGGADRPQALRYLMSNFLPGGTIERAYAADPAMRQ